MKLKRYFLFAMSLSVVGATLYSCGSSKGSDSSSAKLADSVTAVCLKMTDINQLGDERVKSREMLILLTSKKLLNENDANSRIATIENHYADLIYKYGIDVFMSSVWNQNDLDKIDTLCSSQLSVTDIGGKPVLSSEMSSNLKAHLGILSDYKAAKAVAASASFNGIADAKAKISEVNKWQNNKILSNNTQLMSELQAVPCKLSDSHYASLEAKLAGLKNWSAYSDPDSYENAKFSPVIAACNEYDNAGIYGEYTKSTLSIRERAHQLFNQGVNNIFENQMSRESYDDYDFLIDH